MSQQLKVLLVNHSDATGGAAVVTYRLMNALRDAGVDARMLVFNKTTDSPLVTTLASRFTRTALFAGECLGSAIANGFSRANLFTVSPARTGIDISTHPLVTGADAIILNWVNQGMLSITSIQKLLALGKPVLWTMHDMWPMTGVCHHAHDCPRYTSGCGNCPLLWHGRRSHDRSSALFKLKRSTYAVGNLTFIPVSNWLASKAARPGSLLADADIRVIPNAFPADAFVTTPRHLVQSFNIDYTKRLIVMGAARLDDPVKGLDYAIDALNILFDDDPAIANEALAIFFGDLRDPDALQRLRFPYRHIGRVNDTKMLINLYAAAQVVISTSICETLPGTLIEGQASGCIPVAFDNGGQADIIDHLRTGYLARHLDPADIAKGIIWALDRPIDRATLHDEVTRKFSSKTIAQAYIDLIRSKIS